MSCAEPLATTSAARLDISPIPPTNGNINAAATTAVSRQQPAIRPTMTAAGRPSDMHSGYRGAPRIPCIGEKVSRSVTLGIGLLASATVCSEPIEDADDVAPHEGNSHEPICGVCGNRGDIRMFGTGHPGGGRGCRPGLTWRSRAAGLLAGLSGEQPIRPMSLVSGDPPVQTGNLRVNPVVWDNNVCHTYWYVYHGQGNVAHNIFEGEAPAPPPPPPPGFTPPL